MKTDAQLLRTARFLIAEEKHWCQSRSIAYLESGEIARCLGSALMWSLREWDLVGSPAETRLVSLVNRDLPRYPQPDTHLQNIAYWNDDYKTTHAKVLKHLDDLIIECEDRESPYYWDEHPEE